MVLVWPFIFAKMHPEVKGEKPSQVSQIHKCDLAKTLLSKQILLTQGCLLQNDHIQFFSQKNNVRLTFSPKYGDHDFGAQLSVNSLGSKKLAKKLKPILFFFPRALNALFEANLFADEHVNTALQTPNKYEYNYIITKNNF